MKIIRAFMIVLAWGLSAPAFADLAHEQLIVFVQPDASPLARDFAREHLPRLEALAEEMGLALQVIDVAQGAPPDVGLTPLIAYQNHLGRSIYQGRYATLDRLRRHIGTARVMAPSHAPWRRPDTLVRPAGRMKVAMPIKVTALQGEIPKAFDPATFDAMARDAIAQGAVNFDLQPIASLGRSDRLFYADFYPHLAPDGTLSVATALFSQFHCHQPVFVGNDPPVTGPWAQRQALFAQAGAKLAWQIATQMQNVELGDGFDPLPVSVPTPSDDALGLMLPAAPPGPARLAQRDAVKLGPHWQVVADDAIPAVGFRFPPPLEMYAGQAGDVSGHIHFDASLAIDSAKGAFGVATESVTMGEPDLDDQIHSSAMLDVARYPDSRFTFAHVQTPTGIGALSVGQVIPITLTGTFEMMGQSLPLAVTGQLEAFLEATGQGQPQQRLLLTASWRLPIFKPFGLQGPDGPAEAKNHLLFNAHILLEPRTAAASSTTKR